MPAKFVVYEALVQSLRECQVVRHGEAVAVEVEDELAVALQPVGVAPEAAFDLAAHRTGQPSLPICRSTGQRSTPDVLPVQCQPHPLRAP